MISRPSGRDNDSPKPIIFDFGPTKVLQKMKNKPESFLKRIILGNFKTLEIEHFDLLEKTEQS